MKILSVRFANLNSLRGEHHIRFDQSPFTDTGLFAITGQTGAGKSTILDAITVALYGKVARYGNETPTEIMSRQTGECFAEVEFCIANTHYRSKWSLRRAGNKADGTLQQSKMELSNVTDNDRIIEGDKKTEVIRHVENITGLDFHRFTRSVILSQGDFAAFLKAKESERAELLEKMTGTEIYRIISEKVFERAKIEKEILQQLQTKTLLFPTLTAQKVVEQEQLLEQGNAILNELSRDLERLQFCQNVIGQLQNLQHSRQHLEQQQSDNQIQQQQLAADSMRLEQHRKAAPFRKELDRLDYFVANVNKNRQTIKDTEQLLKDLGQEKTSVYQQCSETQKMVTDLQNHLEKIEPHIERAIFLEPKIEEEQKNYRQIEQQQSNITQHIATQQQQIQNFEETIQLIDKQRQKVQNWLSKNDYLGQLNVSLIEEKIKTFLAEKDKYFQKQQQYNASIQEQKTLTKQLETVLLPKIAAINQQNTQKETELQQKEAEFQQFPSNELLKAFSRQVQNEVLVLQKQIDIALSFHEKNKQYQQLHDQYKSDKEEHGKTEQAQKQLQQQYEQAHVLLEKIEKIYETDRQIADLVSQRQNLQPNEACPLCGSTQHPFVEQHYQSNVSASNQQRTEQKQQVEQLQKQLSQTDKQLSALTAKLEHTIKQGKERKEELDQLKAKYQQLAPPTTPIAIENHDQLSVILAEKEQQLQTEESKTQQRQLLQNSIGQLDKELRQQQEELLQLKGDSEVWQSKLERCKKDQQQLSVELQEIRTTAENIRNNITEVLQVHQIPFPDKGTESVFVADLHRRVKEYQQQQNELQNTQQQLIKLQTDQQAVQIACQKDQEQQIEVQQKMTDIQHRLQQWQHNLQTIIDEYFTQNNPQTERKHWRRKLETAQIEHKNAEQKYTKIKTNIKTKGEDLDKLREETQRDFGLWESEQQTLQQNIAPHFASLSDLRAALLKPEESQHIEKIISQHAHEAANIKGQIAANEQQQSQLKTQISHFLSDTDNIPQKIEAIQQQQQEISESIGRAKQQLELHEQNSRQLTDTLELIEKQDIECQKWNTLNHLIGSQKGDKFQVFAQGITLEHLINHANLHLQKLNPRYQIKRIDQLELEIIDTHQANAIRPTRSLSGGESFLVSLALALGLSDLAGRNIRIESLFIDEGFGTLDSDILDIAITTLENLQAQGKMIGIISHVPLLKERIGSQIQVIKVSGGVSEIYAIGASGKRDKLTIKSSTQQQKHLEQHPPKQ